MTCTTSDLCTPIIGLRRVWKGATRRSFMKAAQTSGDIRRVRECLAHLIRDGSFSRLTSVA